MIDYRRAGHVTWEIVLTICHHWEVALSPQRFNQGVSDRRTDERWVASCDDYMESFGIIDLVH